MSPPHFKYLLLLLLTLSPPPILAATSCHPQDRRALLSIFSQFGSPIQKPTLDISCCDWDYITCDPKTGRVIDFELDDGDIVNRTTTIPSAFADLTHLQKLRLHLLSRLVGPIPSFLTKLTSLTFLEISQNSNSGPIPAFLSQLTSLNYLKLDNNLHSGSIPSSLSTLPNLKFLFIGGNKLSGQIPESFGNFGPGFSLDLSRNKLTGTIPASFGGSQWTQIDVSVNRLTGDASLLFGAEKPTEGINIHGNRFSFDLTEVKFPVNLTSVDMSHNEIYGAIPAQVNELSGLDFGFDVSYNKLCGEIPAGVVTAKYGEASYAHNKCLCGAPLPACK